MPPAQEASWRGRRELVEDGGRGNGMFRGRARGESMLSLPEIHVVVISSDGWWEGS